MAFFFQAALRRRSPRSFQTNGFELEGRAANPKSARNHESAGPWHPRPQTLAGSRASLPVAVRILGLTGVTDGRSLRAPLLRSTWKLKAFISHMGWTERKGRRTAKRHHRQALLLPSETRSWIVSSSNEELEARRKEMCHLHHLCLPILRQVLHAPRQLAWGLNVCGKQRR